MRTRTETLYYCEYCDKEFANKDDCEEHEHTHIKDYDSASDEEVIKAVKNLAENCWDYHIGNTVLGMPMQNFISLMETAAKRIEGRK